LSRVELGEEIVISNGGTPIAKLVPFRTSLERRSSLGQDQGKFTVLEEIELLTSDIRGYAHQIQARGWVENEQQAIERLQNMGVFDVPALAKFYFSTDGGYQQMKAYIRMLDYLRLLILEYLCSVGSASLVL